MRHYEVMVVLAPDLAEDGFNKYLERFKKIIENGGGSIVNDDRWGIRSLAYPIRKYDQGFYTVIEWEGAPDLLPELDHTLRLDENVLRHMVVHLDATALEGAAQVRAKRAEAPSVDESVSSDDDDVIDPDDSGEVEADAAPEPEVEESSDPDASEEADQGDAEEGEADAAPEPEVEESSDPDASGEADPGDTEEVDAENAEEEK